jgi:pimeloyl-ACP methyl ester carboxylesterase
MKKTLKWIGILTITILVMLVYSGTYLDVPRKELEAKYATGSSQFLDLPDGARIHFRDEGKPENPAIVLLHGFNGSLFNFERLVPFLVNDFRLISIDLPGFGLTGATPTADYTTEGFIDAVTKLTNELGIEKFSIAGNSMGGGVAWRYTLEFPTKVEGLILLASSGVGSKEDVKKFEERENNTPIVWKLMGSDLLKKFLHYYTPKFFATEGLKRSVYDQQFADVDHANQFHDLVLLQGSRDAILSMTMGGRRKMYGPESLSKITAPTLVIHGEEDNIIGFERSLVFKENIDNAEIKIYPEIGHLPMYEDPARTADDILKFFQDL